MAASYSIPTEYQGVLYRSRTEVRWARFLDDLGIPHRYEAKGVRFRVLHADGTATYDGYRPDFWVPERNLWLEIKGVNPSREEQQRIVALLAARPEDTVLLCIGPPQPHLPVYRLFLRGRLISLPVYWGQCPRPGCGHVAFDLAQIGAARHCPGCKMLVPFMQTTEAVRAAYGRVFAPVGRG